MEEERATARQEGVTREENLPFLLQPEHGGTAGVLLVHGFTATPWEMRPLGEALVGAGFCVVGVRLPGHGTTPEDLAGRRWEEWLAAVVRGYELLAERCPHVYSVGMSTGALLALLLAQAQPLSGLVLLSPYLRLRHPLARATGLVRFIRPFQSHPVPAHLRPFYYERRPVHGIYQLCRLLRRVRRSLDRINTPALVIGSLGDQVIPVDSLQELFHRLGSRHRELHLFDRDVPHVLVTPENPRQLQVFDLIIDFLGRLERKAVG